MKSFIDMSVWNKSTNLLLEIYKITSSYPKEEIYILVSDMKRAANSIPHNIAEGYGRFESRDKTRFYKMARGSAFELISQSIVSEKLNFINSEKKEFLLESLEEIISELNAIIKTLETK